MPFPFPSSYAGRSQMLSGNQSSLYLNSCSFSCGRHILPSISLIDPCNLYFHGDIIFALLVESSAFKNNNNNNNKLAEAVELVEDKAPYYKYTPVNVLENENFKPYGIATYLRTKNGF
jgi:hypothetical protein